MPGVERQQALTALFPVAPERVEALGRLLAERSTAVCDRLHAAETLHFARFVVLPAASGAPRPGRVELLLATTFDGPLDAHLDELWTLAGAEITAILSCCHGFNATGGRAELGRFVRRSLRPAAALYAAEAGLSVARVRADARLRREVRQLLDAPDHASLDGQDAEARASELHRRLGTPGAAPPPVSLASSALGLWDWLALASVWLRSLVLDATDALSALWHDVPASAGGGAPSPAAPRVGLARCFSHVAVVKPGRARRRMLRLVLRLLAGVGSRATGTGMLAGSAALHGARWLLLEDGRLLFLGDFAPGPDATPRALVERLGTLLGLVWSHTLGFPATLGWRFGSGRDEVGFRLWASGGALDAGITYSAYPELGCREIRENAEIRRLLAAPPSAAGARELFGLVRD